jgi:predicted alpha/beta hydrolase family esterase
MRVAEADILIVPGWSDSGPEHWQTRWQAKLSTARRVTQRDFEKPIRAEWEETIAQRFCTRPV